MKLLIFRMEEWDQEWDFFLIFKMLNLIVIIMNG